MPIYEFECPCCGHKFEKRWSITHAGRKTYPCPQCQGKAKRVFSVPAAVIMSDKPAKKQLTGFRKGVW